MTSQDLAAAEAAVEKLFYDPEVDVDFEPADEASAHAAITRLGCLFDGLPGLVKAGLAGARSGAETLSGDRLQGLAEIVQNADDVGARHVSFQVAGGALTAVHDGRPIRLRDLQALATPWVSSKVGDADSTGRFGIGLMTLRTLAASVDVHCGPYHLRLSDSTLVAIDAADVPVHAAREGVTVFAIPLPPDVDAEAVAAWLGRWDDSSLLFCRHVERIELLGPDGSVLLTLGLDGTSYTTAQCVVGGAEVLAERRYMRTLDGRSWLVHRVEVVAPVGVGRAHKASSPTMPLAVALPLDSDQHGALHAGLPILGLRIPIRVSAQFDPVTSRQQLADTRWNAAIFPLAADLWAHAAEELFLEDPQAAWATVPLPADTPDEADGPPLVQRLEELLLDRARLHLAGRLRIQANGRALPITELATEEPRLQGLLSPEEIAALAQTTATLPSAARDTADRWRLILEDWRADNPGLPEPVSVEAAMVLFKDTMRSADQTIALSAAALDSGLQYQLANYPCIVTAEGGRIPPPAATDHCGLLSSPHSLAQQLGVGLLLHPVYSTDRNDAGTVLRWLRQRGAIIDTADSDAVLRRIAAAGHSGSSTALELSDEQLIALRDAFEQLDPRQRDRLGHDIGSAIELEAFSYDRRGERTVKRARPADAYLPRAIDREKHSFAQAAATTPGLLWLHVRYAEVLRSPLGGSAGLGPQRFLRLLGAEIAPRLARHAELQQRYDSESRRGLHTSSGPAERSRALQRLSATYTLEDVDSPDLRRVAGHIAREKDPARRQQRAAALLATLGRAWERLADRREVRAASDHYRWIDEGPVKAFWLWSAGSIAWLDDAEATPRPPGDTRLRTPGTLAVYGDRASGYLHPDLDLPNRREVLAAFGVTGDPTMRDLVQRLKVLRDKPQADTDAVESAIVYEALARKLASADHSVGDLSLTELRRRFAEPPGLILTMQGWRTPQGALAGVPLLGRHRAFIPQVRNTDRLWRALQVREPSLEDCIAVIGECARTRQQPEGEDAAVMLEALRRIAYLTKREQPTKPTALKLRRLSVWTSQGWATKRPVYVTDDPALAEGLGAEYCVWRPGGQPAQFEALFGPFHIHHIRSDDTAVVDPDAATTDDEVTRLWRSTIALFREDLALNAPAAATALRTTWDELSTYDVRTNGNLSVRVTGLVGGRQAEVPVRAKIDTEARTVFLASPRDLRRVDGGGHALAGLFDTDPRQIAQAWIAACAAADDAPRPQLPIELAQQRAQAERSRTGEEMASRLEALRRENAEAITAAGNSAKPGPTGAPRPVSPAPRQAPPRQLVDAATLTIIDPWGRAGGAAHGTPNTAGRPPRAAARAGQLVDPSPDARPPRAQVTAPEYTQAEVESLGLELVRRVFERDDLRITDLRAQHGVGSDAVDTLRRFYELKVHRGDEPDVIRLEKSEIERAISTPDFFLVIVSGLDGPDARPRVRVILDPLSQLTVREESSLSFAGVRGAEHSLIYDFKQEE